MSLRRSDARALEILLSWRGLGEEPGGANNVSDWLMWLRANDGTGMSPSAAGPWCAALQSAADMVAARRLEVILPYRTSRSAKRYTAAVADAGEWVARPRGPWGKLGVKHLGHPRAGDRICWHRGDPDRRDTRRQGHVARVVDYSSGDDRIRIVEGNRNNKTAPDGRRYAVVKTRWVSDWRRRLYGIARLA